MELMDLLKEKRPMEEPKDCRSKFLLRYVISGVSSVVAQFAVLAACVEFLSADPVLSSGIAYVIGCLVNYLMLYFWTFNSSGSHAVTIFKYLIVTTSTLFLNLALFWSMIEVFHFWYLFSQVFATVMVALANMFLNQQFTFAASKLSPAALEEVVKLEPIVGVADYEQH